MLNEINQSHIVNMITLHVFNIHSAVKITETDNKKERESEDV